MGRALILLVLIGLCAGCGSVYTSKENALLIRDFQDELDYDTPPVMVEAVRPEYPEIAQKMGAEGIVRLKALILEDGGIGGIQIVESANPVLVDAAITALRRSLFMPAKKGGQPCCGTVVIPFVFGSGDAEALRGWGVEVDRTESPQEEDFVPVEPPPSAGQEIKPAK